MKKDDPTPVYIDALALVGVTHVYKWIFEYTLESGNTIEIDLEDESGTFKTIVPLIVEQVYKKGVANGRGSAIEDMYEGLSKL